MWDFGFREHAEIRNPTSEIEFPQYKTEKSHLLHASGFHFVKSNHSLNFQLIHRLVRA